MAQKSGAQLKTLADQLAIKYRKTIEDEEQAITYFNQAIDSQELSQVLTADCYKECAKIYMNRIPKTLENYKLAIKLLTKSSEVPGLPSWYSVCGDVERLAMCPEVFGFNPEARDTELASQMHKRNLLVQNGGDLTISTWDWFSRIEDSKVKANPEWVKVGFDYLDHAISIGWDTAWKSIMYTLYGRGYKYHSEKIADNFNNAVKWFKDSINLKADANSSNQPWTIIGRGTARAYFELAELLSNPARFGFDSSLKNEEEGKKIYNEGKKHISQYSSEGPRSLIGDMYLDLDRKTFHYLKTGEDVPTISDLIKLGIETKKSKDSVAALYLYEATAHLFLKNESNDTFKHVAENYYKCFETCKEDGIGKNWIAENAAKFATPLIFDPVSECFSPETKTFEITKKLENLLREIGKSNGELGFSEVVQNIINVNIKLHEVVLDQIDPILKARMKETFDFILAKVKEDRSVEEKELAKLNSVKLKLKDIQRDMQLYGYYDGFIFTLSQAYTTAQVVSSGQVVIDNSPNALITLGIRAASYIPFIGNLISEPLNSIAQFIRGSKMIKESNNVCTLASNQAIFDEIFQDAIIEVINSKREEIINIKEETSSTKKWYESLSSFFEKLKVSMESTVYGLRFRTPTQRLGSLQANDLLSKWIASGKIYGDKPFLLPDDARIEIVRILMLPPEEEKVKDLTLTSPDFKQDKYENLPEFKNKNGTSKCCKIF